VRKAPLQGLAGALTVARTRERAAPPGELETRFRSLRIAGSWTPGEVLLVESRASSAPAGAGAGRYRVRLSVPLARGPRSAG
jgi:hypothetical protein